jgi:hypothetical protein
MRSHLYCIIFHTRHPRSRALINSLQPGCCHR